MTTTSLARTVQDSKAQRQERLKTRFRDRGGCVFSASLPRLFLDVRSFININQHLRALRGEPTRRHLACSRSQWRVTSQETHPTEISQTASIDGDKGSQNNQDTAQRLLKARRT
jgi:hypothetical protein